MIKKYCFPHLILLAIASIVLFLFTTVNCNNNDQMEPTLFENRLTNNRLYGLSGQENFNNEKNDEDIQISIRGLLKPYSYRRSSFHAMRGKRQAI